jgi:DNA-directed RNA polymerase I subunit RPA43
MSIETPAQPTEHKMGSSQSPSKPHKKDKSSEKKRKREHGEDGHKSKSKKHKSDKAADKSTPVPEAPATSSPFHVQTSSLYLPLASVSQGAPLEGLCAEHISPLILTYFPPFRGVILSYSNPRLSEEPFGDDGNSTLLQSVDEYAVSWGWVTAEFLLFKPDRGAWLEGFVNLQNEGHLGVVCWNLFNASIKRNSLPQDWKWVGVEELGKDGGEVYAEDGQGYFVDGEGKKIEGMVKFRIREIESSHDKERGFLSIEGTMLDDKAEKQLLASERQKKTSRETAGRRLGGANALGATNLGVPAEPDMMDIDGETRKHRVNY